MREGPSTSTSSVRPTKRWARSERPALHDLDEPLQPLHLDLVRHLVGSSAASVPRRGE